MKKEANPLLIDTPVPDFSQYKAEHFMPAVRTGLKGVDKNIRKIRDNKAPATFENTILPLESLFKDIDRVQLILGNMTMNAYSKKLSKVEEKISIKTSSVGKKIFQDPVLGARFKAVWDQRDQLGLDEDDQALLKRIYDSFESSGAFLAAEGQKRIREIDERLISLAQKFKDNILAAPKQHAVIVTDKAELAGLTENEIAGLAKNARKRKLKNAWVFEPERLMVDDLLKRAEHPAFREKMFRALNSMGKEAPLDNRPIIKEMQSLRQEYARLLGYDHYTSFSRSRAMKKDLAEVKRFMADVASKALPRFEEELRDLEKFSAANGGPAKLKPWDAPYWVERRRKDLYNFDGNAFGQHLELESVLKGMFAEAEHILGIKFKENGKYPVMHEDIRTFDVVDAKTGKEVGILHVDMYARAGLKGGGAWMSQLQMPSEGHPNVIILNMNIAKPPAGQKALVPLSQYITLYHEMGHSLHGLMGNNVKYNCLQGTNNSPADYVEIHSMVNEHRAVIRENLKKYGLHVETGKPLPDDVIDRFLKSKSYFESRDMLLLVQNGLRDFEFHSIDPKDYKNDEEIEKSVALNSEYADHIRPYPLTRFGHLFDYSHSGYAAGYINYLIAQAHAADAYKPFEKDPYNKTQAEKLGAFYRRGSGGDLAANYRGYLGRDATADAMLEGAGIVTANNGNKPAKTPPSQRVG